MRTILVLLVCGSHVFAHANPGSKFVHKTPVGTFTVITNWGFCSKNVHSKLPESVRKENDEFSSRNRIGIMLRRCDMVQLPSGEWTQGYPLIDFRIRVTHGRVYWDIRDPRGGVVSVEFRKDGRFYVEHSKNSCYTYTAYHDRNQKKQNICVGDMVNGWKVMSLRLIMKNSSKCYMRIKMAKKSAVSSVMKRRVTCSSVQRK